MRATPLRRAQAPPKRKGSVGPAQGHREAETLGAFILGRYILVAKRKATRGRKQKRRRDDIAFGEKVTEENFLRATIDPENKQIRVYTNDMLIKRLHRESNKIAKSFDNFCKVDLVEISRLFSEAVYLIGNGNKRYVGQNYETKISCGKLLINAMNTIQASVELLRSGYILQPGMLLRSVIETVSTISYFMIEPEGYKKYVEGKLDVNKTIKYGKQVIPPLGNIHSFLSNNFVHISSLHGDFNIVTEYKEMTEPLSINLSMIKTAIWLIFIISELVYYDYVDKHLYWERLEGNGYKFELTGEIKEWMKDFFERE